MIEFVDKNAAEKREKTNHQTDIDQEPHPTISVSDHLLLCCPLSGPRRSRRGSRQTQHIYPDHYIHYAGKVH